MLHDKLTQNRNRAIAAITLISAAFVYLLLFKLPATPILFEGDHLIFLYDADRMLKGDVLYRDFNQFTFPGGQFIYFVLMLVFGPKLWILPAMITAIAAVSTFLMLRISRHLFEGYVFVLPALVYIFFGFRFYGIDGSHRMLSPVLTLAAIASLSRGSTTVAIALAGAACAAASFFTQQRGFVVAGAIGIFLLVESIANGGRVKDLLKKWSMLSVSFVVALIVLLIYFIAPIGLQAFYKATIEYPSLYYGFHEENTYGVFWNHLINVLSSPSSGLLLILASLFYSFVVPLAPLLFFARYAVGRRQHDWEYWRLPMLLAIVSLVSLLATTAPSQFRIFQISAPAIILLVWLVWEWLRSRYVKASRIFLFAAATGLLILGSIQAARTQFYWKYVELDLPAGHTAMLAGPAAERYRWLAANTKASDYFYELAQPFTYFPLQLRNATPVSMIFQTELTRPEFVEAAVEGLEANQPRYVLFENQYIMPFERRKHGDHTAPLADYVNTNYAPIGEVIEINGRLIQIWERKAAEAK